MRPSYVGENVTSSSCAVAVKARLRLRLRAPAATLSGPQASSPSPTLRYWRRLLATCVLALALVAAFVHCAAFSPPAARSQQPQSRGARSPFPPKLAQAPAPAPAPGHSSAHHHAMTMTTRPQRNSSRPPSTVHHHPSHTSHSSLADLAARPPPHCVPSTPPPQPVSALHILAHCASRVPVGLCFPPS